MTFSEWLENEIETRGWSRMDAARRAGVSYSMFDKVINERSAPGLKFLNGFAKAFRVDPIVVYRAAGVFPPARSEDDEIIKGIINLIDDLPDDEKENIYEYVRMRRRLMEEKEARKQARTRPA